MHKDLLKRLDEIMADEGERCDGLEPHMWQELRAEWLSLRAELVLERCENCKYWGWTWPGRPRTGACDEFPSRPVTKPDFYCANFVKKES